MLNTLYYIYMPAIRRTTKQISYAALVVGIISLFVFLFVLPYFSLFQQEDTTPPTVRESIVIESIDAITHEGTVDIVALVRNPNPKAGVPDYTLVFVLLDVEGNEIETISEQTYLLPGSLKYVSVLDVAISKKLDKVRVDQPADPIFVDSKQFIPTFNSFLRTRSIRNVGNRRVEIQKGIVTNTSDLGFRYVDVSGVAFDSKDNVVGVSKTFLGEVQAGEQREFTLQWPQPFVGTVKVIVLPDTNIYRKDNVLPVTGDPGNLRDEIILEEG